MKKKTLLLSATLLFGMMLQAQPLKTKTVGDGGSGPYKAIAVSETSLPDYVVYRPSNLSDTHMRHGAMPVLLWANGGCSDSNVGYEQMLTEVASHGYVVVAIGALQEKAGDRKDGHTPSSDLLKALDWVETQGKTKGSDYYQLVDVTRIAAAGHSCGGAQVLCNAGDPRLSTYLIMNAGMGDMEMSGASKASLANVHGPIIYVIGGPSDVAHANAVKDYARINHQPVVFADMPSSGHGGTYGEKHGGDYGRLVLDWLDWHLKGKKEKAEIFLNGNLKDYSGWTVKSKNFGHRPGTVTEKTMPCKLLKGITEREYSIYLPGGYAEDTDKTYPVLYLLHGGGGSHTDWQRVGNLKHLADSLIDCGAVEDMIIVCPEANKNNMIYFNAPEWKYEDFFFQEFMPYIEKTYRVRKDKGGRAIAGFSMGGGGAVVYGVHHPEKFAMVYDISGYLRRQPLDFLKDDPSAEWRQQIVEENNPIVRISNGTADEVKEWSKVDWVVSVGDQDFTIEGNMDLVKAFRQKNIPYAMSVGSGKHDWNYVAPALVDAMKRADNNFKSLWVEYGNRKIFGLLSRPQNAKGRQPVAIIAHGFNGTHHFSTNYFKPLNDLGYQCYAFDFACGSVNSRSDNNTMNMSIFDEQSDLEAIVRHFKSQPDVDTTRIVLIGESQGGLVSALTAANISKDIHKLVLVFPALCIPENWTSRYPKVEDIPDTTRLWNVPMGRRFFTEIRDLKVFKEIPKFKKPVLIVQGDADMVVLVEDSRKAAKLYKDARLHIIPGAGHGFKPDEFAESIEQITSFLKE